MRPRGVLVASLGGLVALSAGAAADPARRRLTTHDVWIDPARDLAPDVRPDSLSHIIYVNRCVGGCTVTPGNNDSRAQTSSIISGTVHISELSVGASTDQVFNDTIACLRELYGPYDVQIVTEDPGDVLHHEAILAGSPQEIGEGDRTAGVAPLSCTPINNVISFSFGNFIGPDVDTLCWTVAQESAHSFGLPNHVYDCSDAMTYLEVDPDTQQPCGRKYFRDKDIRCGEFMPIDCRCDVSSQNSHQKLLDAFGPGTSPAPPEVTLAYPPDGSSVTDNFSVFFNATDARGIDHADVFINGARVARLPGYDFVNRNNMYDTGAPSYPDGYLDVAVKAYDDLGTEGDSDTVTVVKGQPCTSADSCFDSMTCDSGHCDYPDGTIVCSGGQTCPDGRSCTDQGICGDAAGGGCCAVAGARRRALGPAAGELLLFGLVVVGLRLRRRRRRC